MSNRREIGHPDQFSSKATFRFNNGIGSDKMAQVSEFVFPGPRGRSLAPYEPRQLRRNEPAMQTTTTWFTRVLALLGLETPLRQRSTQNRPEVSDERVGEGESTAEIADVPTSPVSSHASSSPSVTTPLSLRASSVEGESTVDLVSEETQETESLGLLQNGGPDQATVEMPDSDACGNCQTVDWRAADLEQTRRRLLRELRKFTGWREGGKAGLEMALAAYKHQFPEQLHDANEAIALGRDDAELIDRVEQLARREGPESPALCALLKQAQRDRPFLINKLRSKVEWVANRRANARANCTAERAGKPYGQVKPPVPAKIATGLPPRPLLERKPSRAANEFELHGNDIRALEPCSHWQIAIDETGSVFDQHELERTGSHHVGRVVALVKPAYATLPKLRDKHHATAAEDPAINDDLVQAVLDAKVGVFGLEVSSLPRSPGDRWYDAVLAVVDWILRLLPIEPHVISKVTVFVENRGTASAGQNWQVLASETRRRLAQAFPLRAAAIDLQISVVSKDGCQWNPYVDAIAHTWGSVARDARTRLKNSGWLNTCLMANVGHRLLYAWDLAGQGLAVPTNAWWNLVREPAHHEKGSIVQHLLQAIGTEFAHDPMRWSAALDEVRGQMGSGPIDLCSLAFAAKWLDQHRPPATELPGQLKLAWLTVLLANSNHRGEAHAEAEDEAAALSERLVEEAAPLVCDADLHRAVACTNRFDFQGARSTLKRWQEVPANVPGLCRWAQVQSSLGQHAAFLGQFEQASVAFERALRAFRRLSDPQLAARECERTAIYAAIAHMDWSQINDEQVHRDIHAIVGDLTDAATRLAQSVHPHDRYLHHVLIRCLVHRPHQQANDAYLACQQNWAHGADYPWPVIEIYRSLLTYAREPQAALDRLQDVRTSLANADGPVLRMIGACAGTIEELWGGTWPEGKMTLRTLEKALPLASQSIAALQRAQPGCTDPGTLLQQVLPFNFR
jgi:hypothetical protein